jgi:16S rRNA (adenine1518-N6/adenine1519-N6)-dimethyltransferase
MKRRAPGHYGLSKAGRDVAPKKALGQHFLNDRQIASDIVHALLDVCPTRNVLEIGPGMGVLTGHLLEAPSIDLKAIDLDRESVAWLKNRFPDDADRFIYGDFLRVPLAGLFEGKLSVIGNFPYNISTEIVFSVIAHREMVPLLVGMFQKEVAERICASPGSKAYGILSVLTQAWYAC